MDSMLYYFGCIKDKGHYLWADEETKLTGADGINGQFLRDLDGKFCPKQGDPTKRVTILTNSNIEWVIVSWWDNSIDTRPGSHSTFVAANYRNMQEIMKAAREKFPTVFSRQNL